MAGIGVPLLALQLEIGRHKPAQPLGQHVGAFEAAQRIEQVERQRPRTFDRVAVGVHVDVQPLTGIALVVDAVETRGEDAGLQEIGIGRTVGQAQNIRLIPLYEIRDERYAVYFPIMDR